MSAKNASWKLSPSDFAFLWEECQRCYYLKTVSKFERPRPIMPKIFTTIDTQMKTFFSGKRAESIVDGIPHGVVAVGEKWVESRPITLPNHSSSCYIKGKFDTVIRFDDGTYGVVDFKTSERKSEHLPLYARQLHAYAYALENSAPGSLSLKPISRIGLLVYEPKGFSENNVGLALGGDLSWTEIPLDYAGFLNFLAEVISVLEQPSPPAGSPSCQWCQYRDTSRRTGL